MPDSLKKKDDVDGASTMDEFVAVAVSGARGRISCLLCVVLKLNNLSSFFSRRDGVWTFDLNLDFYDQFYLSFFTLVLVSIAKIYETLTTVFDHISKTPRRSSKILRCAMYIKLSSQCLEILCSIHYFSG